MSLRVLRTAGLLATAAALLLTPAAAQAAPALSLTADPVAGVPFDVTVTGPARTGDQFTEVTIRPADGSDCPADPFADPADDVVLTQQATDTGTLTLDAGDYLLCTYLVDVAQGTALGRPSGRTITVRAPHARLSLTAPSRVAAEADFQVGLSATVDGPLSLFTVIVPGPCADSLLGNGDTTADLNEGDDVTAGTSTFTYDAQIPDQGQYVICSYAQVDVADDQAAAVLSRPITVGPAGTTTDPPTTTTTGPGRATAACRRARSAAAALAARVAADRRRLRTARGPRRHAAAHRLTVDRRALAHARAKVGRVC